MDNAILTRYLYFLDEAKYSLMHSIVKKTSFDEVVFWAGEIFYSGYGDDLWNIIWEYYYRFLSIHYPKYEKTLIEKNKNYMENEEKSMRIKLIIESLNVIYYLKKKDFHIYFRENNPINKIYSTNKNWLKLFPEQNYQIILSIHYQNYKNIRWYLQREDVYEFYNIVKNYFELMLNYNLKDFDLKSHPFANKKIIVYALIKYLYEDIENINRKIKTKRIPQDIYKTLKNQNETKKENYKFLERKREYSIHNDISKYSLARYNYDNYKDIYWYKWMYYAYRSPIWAERINKYKIKIDHKQREIIFDSDEEYEEFTELYDYEPDEQTLETQNKSIMELTR